MKRALGGLVERAWTRRHPWERAASALLLPASWPYGLASALRNRLYDLGGLPMQGVSARVVSVGNLAVGGTGKTPIVLWLAERLAARGHRVAIVARGYRKQRRGVVVVGRDGHALVAATDGGDEAVLLARRFAGPVIVGEDRVAAAATAHTECGAEIILLDDGFQHRRLRRDLDLVVLADDPRTQRCLPAGPLREGVGALGRAGAVIVAGGSAPWADAVVPRGLPVFRAETTVTALLEVRGGTWNSLDPGVLRGTHVAALAGIARPERFLQQLVRLGARVGATRLLDDHHVFDQDDRCWIAAAARHGPVVTTEKDLVKILEIDGLPPVWALRVTADVQPADALIRLAAGEDVVWPEARPERR